jgi:hypothetical protein
MSGWLWLAVYIVGYLVGVGYGIGVARRAYADRDSMLWGSHDDRPDADAAVMCGLAILFLPLIWPIIGIGMLGWALVTRGVDHGADDRST